MTDRTAEKGAIQYAIENPSAPVSRIGAAGYIQGVANDLATGRLTATTSTLAGRGALIAKIANSPSLLFDFTNSSTPTIGSATLTYTGSNGTYFNSSGTLTAATTNVPRLDYDPATLVARGLLIEEARTNLFLNSLINGTNLSTQSVAVSATPYTLSFYGTGTITLSGASTAGPLTGSGAYPTRSTLTFTPSAGSLTCTVTGTVQYAQIEAGSFATSFIPTAGTTVTRTADVASITGASFSSFWNATQGTIVASYMTAQQPSVQGVIFTAQDATGLASNSDFIVLNTSSGKNGSGNTFAAAANQGRLDGASAYSANALVKAAYSFNSSGRSLCTNGGTVATSASATRPTGQDRASIGNDGAGTNIINGWISSLAYYTTRKTDSQLQALST